MSIQTINVGALADLKRPLTDIEIVALRQAISTLASALTTARHNNDALAQGRDRLKENNERLRLLVEEWIFVALYLYRDHSELTRARELYLRARDEYHPNVDVPYFRVYANAVDRARHEVEDVERPNREQL